MPDFPIYAHTKTGWCPRCDHKTFCHDADCNWICTNVIECGWTDLEEDKMDEDNFEEE